MNEVLYWLEPNFFVEMDDIDDENNDNYTKRLFTAINKTHWIDTNDDE